MPGIGQLARMIAIVTGFVVLGAFLAFCFGTNGFVSTQHGLALFLISFIVLEALGVLVMVLWWMSQRKEERRRFDARREASIELHGRDLDPTAKRP